MNTLVEERILEIVHTLVAGAERELPIAYEGYTLSGDNNFVGELGMVLSIYPNCIGELEGVIIGSDRQAFPSPQEAEAAMRVLSVPPEWMMTYCGDTLMSLRIELDQNGITDDLIRTNLPLGFLVWIHGESDSSQRVLFHTVAGIPAGGVYMLIYAHIRKLVAELS